ncbi:iron uptake transporter permease EfeU [Solicola gregarius]|uniref:FTR1 family protein n=1 Tax=Solicola gregarius TaxID=2908642 RepID=A0AA46THS6_9ACTN|nr:iron uptake transporter permease EfeU [Solicola gregarius]UYM04763.1 FTR1 family protein [Solicola gregarius]
MLLANFLIGLREGLEAALIVSILVAYLVKTDRRDRLPAIWLGVGAAVALALMVGAVLQFTSRAMTFEQQELLGGTLSIVAVAFVTWMVFWMRRAARGLKGELHGRLDHAMDLGPLALAVVAFLAVGREGLETSLFFWAAAQTSSSTVVPLIGILLGLAVAAVLGVLFYLGALRINLSRFFTITGALLIVVAAGVLAYGFHDLQEADFLPGLYNLAFDISGTLRPDGWLGTLLKGTINFQPNPTWLQVIVWLAYIVPVMALFLFGARTKKPQPAST